MNYEHIVHPFGPLYDEKSKVLVLGSLPSVKSREQQFFYGHPQNRYWPLLADIFEEEIPGTIEEKKKLVLKHHIAMWDTIYSCDIKGSSDSSIKNVQPTNLKKIAEESGITHVVCNGKTSGSYYHKYQEKELGIKAIVLSSFLICFTNSLEDRVLCLIRLPRYFSFASTSVSPVTTLIAS